MYTLEYDPTCPGPNQSTAIIGYLDSLAFFEPRW